MSGVFFMVHRGQIYQHYKGNCYLVLEIATHTETNEELVIYANVKNKAQIWARPLKMFEETLPNGKPRFELVA